MQQWFIARIRPGYGRVIGHVTDDDGNISDVTRAESQLAERNFRTYCPRMRKETRHHRSKKIIVKPYPLFTGYLFVDRWGGLSDCPAVSCVLGVNGTPWPVPAAEVDKIRTAERNMMFDETREARVRRREEGRTRRETVAMTYPEGTEIQVTDGPFRGFFGHVTSVSGRGHVRAMMDLFGRLTPVELDPAALAPLTNISKRPNFRAR